MHIRASANRREGTRNFLLIWLLALSAGACGSAAEAAEDIEFVAEHLPEVAMDNRYAALPVFTESATSTGSWSFVAQAGYADTATGDLGIAGPMLSAAIARRLNASWTVGSFVFLDDLSLSGTSDLRPLQTLFSPQTPIERPVETRFEGLDGRMHHYGVGLNVSFERDNGWLGVHHWVGGLLWERIELRDYRFGYEVLEGASVGVSGQIDFDADYQHITPFLGVQLPRRGVRWAFAPHALITWPVPRRGVIGHITGPGFDLRGDTEKVGNGKHFGDPSLTLGLNVTYLPANLSFDIGALITQRLFEPLIHDGVESNWVVSFQWRY